MATLPSASLQLAERKPVAPVWHTALFVAGLVGFAYLQHLPGVAARATQAPSRIPTYILTVGFELFLLGYVWLLGLRPYKISMREIVGGRWDRWADFWKDVGVAMLFWVAIAAMLLVVSVTLHFSGAEAAKFLLPQTTAEMAVWVLLAWTAGFCEEFIFRGYLQRQFLAWTGNTVAAVMLQGIIFGVAHWYQGGKGVIVISIYGMMFGILAAMRKSLRPGMIQHGTQDTVSGLAGALLTRLHYLHVLRL